MLFVGGSSSLSAAVSLGGVFRRGRTSQKLGEIQSPFGGRRRCRNGAIDRCRSYFSRNPAVPRWTLLLVCHSDAPLPSPPLPLSPMSPSLPTPRPAYPSLPRLLRRPPPLPSPPTNPRILRPYTIRKTKAPHPMSLSRESMPDFSGEVRR